MELARFGSRVLTRPVAVASDLAELDGGGQWALVVTFEGQVTAVRFEQVSVDPFAPTWERDWRPPGAWTSSMTKGEYLAGVETIRSRVADGTVYQVNLCRVLSAPLPADVELPALAPILAAGNPAPFAGTIHVPSAGVDVVCASPEAYLVREGDRVTSSPIKGTGRCASDLGTKDHAENVMITDLVRNDLSRVAETGTVSVESLCAVEQHPGLVHLASTVSVRLRSDARWRDILAASFPPGSVSGAPKSSALQAISDLEPTVRGPYCGAIGWVDADEDRARLAVGIRTFWADDQGEGRMLRFGTGAGITWGSDPEAEWRETELKAARLVGLAGGELRSGPRP